jgi:uncharacterized membrane protein HdeD (DUF308 family)
MPKEVAMYDELARRWWIVAARGLVALVFGVAAFTTPEKTLAFLISLFGLFALADGVFTMGAGLSANWYLLFLEGFVGGAVGLLTYFFPAVATLWFIQLISAWALVTGALELVGAIRLRREAQGPMVRGEWLLGVSGGLSVLFGVLLALVSGPATTLVWLLGAYALASGALLVALAFNVKHWTQIVVA